jgi:hypothetical protein
MKEIKTKPITVEGDAAGNVPKSLAKFVGADGELDTSKLVQSFLDAEAKVTVESQKRSDAERAYSILADSFAGGDGDDAGAGRKPAARKSDEPLRQSDAKPVVKALIEMTHPELTVDPVTGKFKNPEFFDGLKVYVGSMPMHIKQAIAEGDFEATDWAVRQYKVYKAAGAASARKSGEGPGGEMTPNFIEGGSNSHEAIGKTWTKAEIMALMKDNPKEYAKLADTEIAKAYDEGRVRE